mgnify:CR=1 FL=1
MERREAGNTSIKDTNHAVFKKLESLHALGKDNQAFKDLCTTLYLLALLIEGVMPDNPADNWIMDESIP